MNNLTKSIVHGVVSGLLFAIPLYISSGSAVLTITVGSVLNAVYHWLLSLNV